MQIFYSTVVLTPVATPIDRQATHMARASSVQHPNRVIESIPVSRIRRESRPLAYLELYNKPSNSQVM